MHNIRCLFTVVSTFLSTVLLNCSSLECFLCYTWDFENLFLSYHEMKYSCAKSQRPIGNLVEHSIFYLFRFNMLMQYIKYMLYVKYFISSTYLPKRFRIQCATVNKFMTLFLKLNIFIRLFV